MITRYRAWMDGHPLDEIDAAVCILDIQESAPAVDVQTQAPARGDGVRVMRRSRTGVSVTISLAIREQDVARRKEIAGRINAWAQGAYLSVNDRPGQRLGVVLTTPLAVTSALKWTDTLRMTFTAYESPWWEETFASSAVMGAGTAGSLVLPLPGDGFPVPVEVTATAQSPTSMLELRCGDTRIRLEGLGLGGKEVLRIHYTGGVQHIDITGSDGKVRGVLAARTTDSDDDLLATAGKPTAVSYTASGTVQVAFLGRGRFA